jgi:hypothetical protein
MKLSKLLAVAIAVVLSAGLSSAAVAFDSTCDFREQSRPRGVF